VSRPPIRIRLTLWFAVALLLIVAPFGGTVLYLQWRSAHALLDHHLEEDLEVAVQMLRRSPAGIGWASLDPTDPGYDAGPQRWVEVFNTGGNLIFARGRAQAPGIRTALPKPIGSQGFQTVSTPAGARVRLLTATRTVAGGPAIVRVARAEDEIHAQWQNLLAVFLLAVPLAVLASAGIGYVLAGRALAPLARMAERARSITADRLNERLPVENADDELGQMATVFNRTLSRLEESFARLARFTADASHELRTPLTALRSVGEVGLRDRRSADEYRDIIGSMLEEADHLTRLVDSLLTLSRGDAGQLHLMPAAFDLADIARDAIAQLDVLAEEKNVRLTLDASPAPIFADRLTLRQAAVNLVDNGIKYSPEGGAVRVRVQQDGSRCVLAVTDEGPGIPVADRARVFDRFYRVDRSRTHAHASVGGTGLGLAIAKWAVTANGGDITLDSSDGAGSTFTISLPTAA
jgi:heavy metal sensor kinase